MIAIDESYQFLYKMSQNDKIIINGEFLLKLNNNDFLFLPKNISIKPKGLEFFELEFTNKQKIKIFRYPMTCKLKDLNNTIQIVSSEHLKLILEKKLKEKVYKNPYFYSKIYRKNIFIDINKIEDITIYFDSVIEIKDKDIKEDLPIIKKIFKEEEDLYKNEDFHKFTYRLISSNFNSYFPDLKVNLTDDFYYINGENRIYLKKKLKIFLTKKNDEFICPICSPRGTGKTISALIFHKLFFKEDGIRGLYLNLKYYLLPNLKWEDKIETLLKECFFICDNDEELFELYEKFIIKNNICELFEIIKNFISNKNKKNNDKDKIYIILDQYKEKYNMNYLFDLFENIKIIAISSINDYDVKDNIIITYLEQISQNINDEIQINYKNHDKKIIRYDYIDNLIDKEYYNSPIFIGLIKDKIIKKFIKEKQEEKNKEEIIKEEGKKIEEEFKFTYYVLKKFDFIPKYFFEYLYEYNCILDLLFDEYSNIMKKLTKFIYNKKIDLEIIKQLKDKKKLIRKKDIKSAETLNKFDFIKIIKYIPLRYINYKNINEKKFYFYYSFPLFDTILKDFINYQSDKNTFFFSENDSEKELIFERILKYQFRVYNKFDIDGYFKVENLINMKPTKKYKMINKEYIVTKNNIFIDQKNKEEKDYDFAIYKPNSNQLLLLKAKYIINSQTIKNEKSFYKKIALKSLNSLNELTKLNISEVYLLFISSIYYNYNNKEKVVNILSNKEINCIFYSLKKNQFYYNFRDTIREIEMNPSYKLIPFSENYINQLAFVNSEFKEGEDFYINNKDKNPPLEMKLEESEDDKGEKEILFLKKKTYRDENELTNIYNDFIIFINNYPKFKNEQITKLLGPFKKIVSCQEIKYKPKSEYVILLYLNEKDLTIEKDRRMGLVIFDKGVQYYLDLKENKNYNSFDEFILKFKIGYFYAIGKKKNN